MKERMNVNFQGPIRKWDEAIPLGNGKIGCLIWGEPKELRFSLDRPDIWDRTVPCHTEDKEFTFSYLISLVKEKNTEKIREIFDAPYQHSVPTKLPAGKIIFQMEQETEIAQTLHMEEAEAVLIIGKNKDENKIRAICHGVTGTGMIRTEEVSIGCSVFLKSPDYGSGKKEDDVYDPEHRSISQGSLKQLHYPEAVQGEKQEGDVHFFWFTQQVDSEFFYGIVLGEKKWEKGKDYFYRILTSRDGEHWLEDGIARIKEEIEKGYEFWLESHKKWWKQYWEKSSISLPDKKMEKQWYITNYLFASCSRKGGYPMSLQGVWTADDGCLPPWKGDYHNDLNTQLSYSHFYKANHLEEGEAFIDFLWKLRGEARDFAKRFYQTDGICLPGVMTIDGKPLGGWPMYSLSPVQQIWLCKSFDDYYRYTGNKKFLESKAWIYFKETAECITQLLVEKEGFYFLPVSSSPEIHDDEQESWVTPNSNYDLALLRYLYGTLCKYAKILGNKEEKTYRRILRKLPQLAVDERKVLKISPDEILKESHRHLSNAMAICPLELIPYDTEEHKEIIDAVIADYEVLGTGMWVGFSFAWMAHLYAIAKNGEGAAEQLKIFWNHFCSPNGFHLNGDFKKRGYTSFHYRPFTLEANMFAADGLQEMLMQMRDGVLECFPAVPEEWKKETIAFAGLRGEDGIRIWAKMEKGTLTSLKIDASHETTIQIRGVSQYADSVITLKEGQNVLI